MCPHGSARSKSQLKLNKNDEMVMCLPEDDMLQQEAIVRLFVQEPFTMSLMLTDKLLQACEGPHAI
jgi:hypothetical protein